MADRAARGSLAGRWQPRSDRRPNVQGVSDGPIRRPTHRGGNLKSASASHHDRVGVTRRFFSCFDYSKKSKAGGGKCVLTSGGGMNRGAAFLR